MPSKEFMKLALQRAREGMAQGLSPYGACLVKEGEVIACVHNVTRATMDPTAHAEIHALRDGCVKLQSLDLTGCEIYATCEPCPMCFTACHNAKVSSIVYGASLEDTVEILAGRHPSSTSDETQRIISAYAQAMDRVTVLADDPSEVLLCHAQFEDRGGIAVHLLHLDGIGVIHQLPRQKPD